MALAVNGILFDTLSADPGSPSEGQVWYNTTEKLFKIYRNSAVSSFVDAAELALHTGDTSNPHTVTLEQARTAGNTLSGSIDMGGNAINNVGAGSLGTDAAQRQWVTDQINSKVSGLDWQDSVLERRASPPSSPVAGDRYLVIATATGAWTGKEKQIAQYDGAAWQYTVPNEGFTLRVEAENIIYTYDGTSWGNIGGAVDHGALLGLADDDHTQYLLADGTRSMSGALNMGTNNITNVGTVDGVTVSAHAARHAPGGADPISTASAVGLDASSTNTTGTGTSLARNDHTHALDTTNGTISTVAADAVASNGTATGLARRDHVHAVSVGTPVTIGTSNAAGTATSLARSDHQHSHGNQAGGSLHSVTSPSVGSGFMPQSNFAASANPTVNDDGSAGYLPGSHWFNTTNGSAWVCISNGTGTALWKEVTNSATILATKAGRVLETSFSGSPKKATVTFATPFPSTSYAVTVSAVISGGTTYAPVVESQLAGSFVINLGTSNSAGLVQVNWNAAVDGESA